MEMGRGSIYLSIHELFSEGAINVAWNVGVYVPGAQAFMRVQDERSCKSSQSPGLSSVRRQEFTWGQLCR